MGELIAEGMLCSTDQKELINNIPFGPNAAIFEVDIVIKPDAYLWRPSAEVYVLRDACNANIAWPIQEEVVKRTTESESNNVSTCSKGVKKKSILMDCNPKDCVPAIQKMLSITFL